VLSAPKLKSQSGCATERNFTSKSSLKIFLENIYLRVLFTFFWFLILYFIFKIEIFYLSFFGIFVSFFFLHHYDNHSKFKKESSIWLSLIPLFSIIIVSILFYFFPYNLSTLKNLNNNLIVILIFIILLISSMIIFSINKNNKYFIFEILYGTIPIFVLNFILDNQTDEKITYYLIILYKVIEFSFGGVYFSLTGTKKIKKILYNFFILEKYYLIFLIILTPFLIIFFKNELITTFVVFWIFLLRICSYMLLSYKPTISIIYILYSIVFLYFSSYLNNIVIILSLIIPNLIILFFKKKIELSKFKNLKF